MKKTSNILLCLILSFVMLFPALGCGPSEQGGQGGEHDDQGDQTIVISESGDIYVPVSVDFNLTSKKEGATVEILPDDLQTFLDYGSTKQQATFLYNYHNQSSLSKVYLDTSNVTLKWQSTGAASYSLFISDNPAFKNAVSLNVSTNSCGVGFLVPGKTYYYTVVDSLSNRSDVDYFTVSDKYSLRNISAGNAYNMRDLGGWKTEDGKTVKYGMVYRSARFDDLKNLSSQSTYAKKVITGILGVKTEIELRNGTTVGTNSYPSDYSYVGAQNFVKCPMEKYSMVIPGFVAPKEYNAFSFSLYPESVNSVKRAFETFADINNYPITYHCAGGADRTGTISFLLNGLLGVSYADLTLDYELTSFSKSNRRWRSNIVDGEFDDSGVMTGTWSEGFVAFGLFYEDIMRIYGTGDNKLSSAIANYLITACGVSQQTLDGIKNIMLY